MGLTAVVENLRALKKTVKKPIVAFRETVHQAYTKAYVGSPERVDEFYNYIKVYQPSKHNDLCMMSITADINRFSMLPDKHTFFHVHKLERHFDRMIATRKQPGVNGDMAIQILSGHNTTFMARYRRYKTRAAAKEAKRNAKRHMALNVKRHTQLPQDNGEAPDTVYPDAPGVPMPVVQVAPVASKTVGTCEEVKDDEDDKVLAEISKAIKDVVMACELTKPETCVVAAPVLTPAPEASKVGAPWPDLKDDNNAYYSSKRVVIKNPKIILKTFPMVDKNKFKVAKPIKKEEKKEEKKEKKSVELLQNVMVDLSLEQKTQSKELQGPSEVTTAVATKTIQLRDNDTGTESDSSEFDNLDSDSDGSDIEELEKIEEKDVDDLEYEMI